jgi:hypothetical protein
MFAKSTDCTGKIGSQVHGKFDKHTTQCEVLPGMKGFNGEEPVYQQRGCVPDKEFPDRFVVKHTIMCLNKDCSDAGMPSSLRPVDTSSNKVRVAIRRFILIIAPFR